jgi:pilus assembly protein CpaE
VEDPYTLHLQQLLRGSNPLLSVHLVSRDESLDRLAALLESRPPEIVFLSVEDLGAALPVIPLIRKVNRSAQIVAMSRCGAGAELLTLMRLGVREWVDLPVREAALAEAMDRLRDELVAQPGAATESGTVVAFMPSKAGSGTSTVAMHVAHASARALGSRVALIDLDLNCGIQAFMAKENAELSICDIAQYADRMDESLWQRMAVPTGEVDLLPGGVLRPGSRIEPHHLHQILGFASRRYPCTFVDLSGNWERYSIEAMEYASRIFLVTSTDFSALYHSRRNLDALREMGIADTVSVVLNRPTYHTGLDKKSVESILGTHPIVTLPNAYHALQAALKDATTIAPTTPFGRGIEELIAEILKEKLAFAGGVHAESHQPASARRFSPIRSVMSVFRPKRAESHAAGA